MDELFTTDELARIYHVAPGSIRRWASEDGLERVERGRRKLYRARDVQGAYDKRHPAAH